MTYEPKKMNFTIVYDHNRNLVDIVQTGNIQYFTDLYFRTREEAIEYLNCLLYTSPSPRDRTRARMPSSA